MLSTLHKKDKMIRVGRCTYDRFGKRTDPVYPEFTSIVVLTKSLSHWGNLGPYVLKDDQGRIMENIWQYQKIYKQVPKSIQKFSRYDPTVIWNHPAEIHAIESVDGSWELTDDYWSWREKGFNCQYAVRYPV